MKYNIAIVEDNIESANKIINYLNRFQKETNLIINYKHYKDGINITDDYEPIYDILILDIEMKIQDGMKTAEKIREYDKDVIIIFITNMSQYAIKGYKVNALSFMLKPVNYFAFKEELLESVNAVDNKRVDKHILLPLRNGIKKVSTDEILYIESVKHDLEVHTIHGKYVFRATLKNFEKKLEDYNFNRCNNSYLVNLLHVTSVVGEFAVVDKKYELKISRGRKNQFMDHLSRYIGGKR